MHDTIKILRDIALARGDDQFVVVADAALDGKEWAIQRIDEALAVAILSLGGAIVEGLYLNVRRAVDTTSPGPAEIYGW